MNHFNKLISFVTSFPKMSSVISETITTTEMKNEEKSPSKLVRTSSIEKIKDLNNYICSQHYYVVPAILKYIRSSQNSLENTLEKTITIYRYILLKLVIYRIFNIKHICNECSHYSRNVILPNIQEIFNNCSDSGIFLKIGIYSTLSMLTLEFFMCIYLLFSSYVPIGLTFLVFGIVSSVFIFYESIKVDFCLQRKHKCCDEIKIIKIK